MSVVGVVFNVLIREGEVKQVIVVAGGMGDQLEFVLVELHVVLVGPSYGTGEIILEQCSVFCAVDRYF